MKILSFFVLLTIISFGGIAQSTLPLRADTVVIEKIGGNATLKIKNPTRDSVGGVLYNIGGGVTAFKKTRKINDTTIVIGGDTISIAGNIPFANGITKSNDTVILGGELNRHTFIVTRNQKNSTTSNNNNALILSNVSKDSSTWATMGHVQSSPYDMSNLLLNKLWFDSDTIAKQYGGVIQGLTKAEFNSSRKTFMNPATPISLPYGGAYMVSQLFPPDTAYWNTSPFGGTASAFAGDLGIGGENKFNLTITSSQTDYPITVTRMGVDYARVNSLIKRELRGNGTAGYVWDWRSHQGAINSGTTNYGSYVNKIYGFMAYGALYSHSGSPSKTKTLTVSTVDTSFAFYAHPQNTATNEVKNGYGFVSDGVSDYNFFRGKFKVGGTLPSTSNIQTPYLAVGTTPTFTQATSTSAPTPYVSFGPTLTNSILVTAYTSDTITAANSANVPVREMQIHRRLVPMENTLTLFDRQTSLTVLSYALGDSVNINPNFGYHAYVQSTERTIQKRSGYSGRSVLNSTNTNPVPSNVASLDFTGLSAANNIRLRGHYAGYVSIVNSVNATNADTLDMWTGYVSTGLQNAGRILKARHYSGVSLGTRADSLWSLYFEESPAMGYHEGNFGIGIRVPTVKLHVVGKGLFTDTLTATTMGNADSTDRVATTAWVKRQGFGSSGSGGTVTSVGVTDGNGFNLTVADPTTTPNISLTTTLNSGSIPFISTGSAISQNNANLFWDNTNTRLGVGTNAPAFKVDVRTNSTSGFAVYNTSALSSASGAFIRGYNAGTPTGADQRFGALIFGTNPTGAVIRNGVLIAGYSEAAWTDGVSHPAYLSFSTNPYGSTTLAEAFRITASQSVLINSTGGSLYADRRRLYVGGSMAIKKDSVPLEEILDSEQVMLTDTAEDGHIKRTNFANVAGQLAIVNDANHSVTPVQSAVRYHNAITATRTLTLPDASAYPNREITVKVNVITSGGVDVTSVSTIYFNGTSGATTQSIIGEGVSVRLKSDGTAWYQIN